MILSAKDLKVKKTIELKDKIAKINNNICFVIIQLGDNFASNKYINNKIKFSNSLGIEAKLLKYDENISENELLNIIEKLNTDKSVHGIIVQLPLPPHIDEYIVSQKITPNKDIDGFCEVNIGKTYLDKESLVSCTANGIIELLKYYKIDIASKHVVIAGRSNLVGKILALLLINLGATVTVCNSKTQNIKHYIDEADIFVSAIGSPKFFTAEYFESENLTIIDVGINFSNGKIVGDVDFENIVDKVQNISPVPGGVGVLTVVSLLENVLKAYEIQNKEEEK